MAAHEPTRVPVASGAGFIRCSCGWRSQVQDDGHMYDQDPYNAEAAFRGRLAIAPQFAGPPVPIYAFSTNGPDWIVGYAPFDPKNPDLKRLSC